MTKHDALRSEQDSLAPIQLDRLSAEEQDTVALMGKGKGLQLLRIAAIVAALGVGGFYAMRGLDSGLAYTEAGAAAGKLQRQHVEGFLRCALGPAYVTSTDSPERLYGALEAMSERGQKGYGRTLSRCLPTLEALPAALGALSAPADLTPNVAQLEGSARALLAATKAYATYLGADDTRYDFVIAAGHIDHITQAWAQYKKHDATLRSQIERKL